MIGGQAIHRSFRAEIGGKKLGHGSGIVLPRAV